MVNLFKLLSLPPGDFPSSPRSVKMELDFLVSLEDENMGQARRSIDADFDDLTTQTSDKTMDLHLSSVSLDPLYLGVLLCLGTWYLVGFSAPIQ